MKLWASDPIKERGAAPYTPPKDWVYNTTGGPVEGKINVHLVPHSHDDTGWQVTVDQYFFSEVYYVVDTVVDQLVRSLGGCCCPAARPGHAPAGRPHLPENVL